MKVFVDASALVAMIRDEADAPVLEARLAAFVDRMTSGLAIWEAARALARLPENTMELAESELRRFMSVIMLRVVPIGPAEATEAVRAHARYGKGTGHPAKLNMGDCFTYACARTNGARLLYKGDDFIHTDLG